MKHTIAMMSDFLKTRGYDLDMTPNKCTIVKHSDDPWNGCNQFLARPDGVYNYVEVQMGGYDEKKRVSCDSFDTACFLMLAMFVAKEQAALQEASLITAIKKDAELVAAHSSDHWRGRFILDELHSISR